MRHKASVTISLINRRTSQVTRFEDLPLRSDLARRLVEQIERLVADLAPGRTQITRRMRPGGATVIDIDLKPFEKSVHRLAKDGGQPPTLTFEQRYRRKPPDATP